ncbi:hypothetical protein ACOME3_003693 [Neoechinorhynchus agilis]
MSKLITSNGYRFSKLPSKYDTLRMETNVKSKVSTPYSLAGNTMVLPPPNVTGQLHIGHAFNAVIQDVHVRSQLMLYGNEISWIPGFDHAGIAGHLAARSALRDSRKIDQCTIRAWTDKRRQEMKSQLKKLGVKLCWDRHLRYKKSRDNKPFIRRQEQLVNWSSFLQTTVSDTEVKLVEMIGGTKYRLPSGRSIELGRMFFVRYDIDDFTGDWVEVATRRPETIFGDVALAVNPDDVSKSHLIGRMACNPLTGERIPFIADKRVYPDILGDRGTGIVKISPAHDFMDFEIGNTHNLLRKSVIDSNDCMRCRVPAVDGFNVYEARELRAG